MIDRRQFAIGGLAALAFGGLARRSEAADLVDRVARLKEAVAGYRSEVEGYGALVPDPARILDLPAGFRYRVISSAGDAMSDGFVVPDHFDGMGCFAIGGDRVALVRNHELDPGQGSRGPAGRNPERKARLRAVAQYGRQADGDPLPGGTTTLVWNLRTGRREREYLSLAGTVANCAGGVTPWGSWLTCEETLVSTGEKTASTHGWVFEVPAAHRGLAAPLPLKALGRFKHEAAAVDPKTGIVYLTEDEQNGLFYRFIPNRKGELARGGRLQALGLRDTKGGSDSRNWSRRAWQQGDILAVRWIDLAEVESPSGDLNRRGFDDGATLFARGEGIHFGSGANGRPSFFFTCTSGGFAKAGQIMRYTPSSAEGTAGEAREPGKLQLFVESRDPLLMDYADNIVVAPTGHLVVCEDRTGTKTNHLRGVTPAGKLYTFARLHVETEFAGACFAPDGRTMFVNLYRPGRTLAIVGDWDAVKA